MTGEAARPSALPQGEAQRQSALLRAIVAPHVELPAGLAGDSGRARRGLAAYRTNLVALAERALGAAVPTLLAMLGEEDFRQLAREFVRAHPPERGDIGEWGSSLPAWIDAHAGLADWPWLADCAALDLAIHRAERAADAAFDGASLGLLASDDPAALCIELLPGTAVVASRWPVVTIHAAHHDRGDFAAVREAIGARHGEAAVVVRRGWRAAVERIDPGSAVLWQAIGSAPSLGAALDAASDEATDFAAWLAEALRVGALKGVRRLAD